MSFENSVSIVFYGWHFLHSILEIFAFLFSSKNVLFFTLRSTVHLELIFFFFYMLGRSQGLLIIYLFSFVYGWLTDPSQIYWKDQLFPTALNCWLCYKSDNLVCILLDKCSLVELLPWWKCLYIYCLV